MKQAPALIKLFFFSFCALLSPLNGSQPPFPTQGIRQLMIDPVIPQLGSIESSFEQIDADITPISGYGQSIEINAELISSKVDALSAAVLTESWSIESKAEIISSKLDTLVPLIRPELWSIESKSEVISSKIDTLSGTIQTNFTTVNNSLDTISHESWSIESKAEVISSKIDYLSSHVTFTVNLAPVLSKLDTIIYENWSIESKAEIISSKCDGIPLIPHKFPISQGTTVPPTLGAQTINQPGSYFLYQDVIGNISIDVEYVTLDLNGFHVAGTITVNNNHITVKNGSADNVFIESVDNVLLENLSRGTIETSGVTAYNVTINSCDCDGITLQTQGGAITDSIVTSSNITLIDSTNVEISNCQVNGDTGLGSTSGSIVATGCSFLVIQNCICMPAHIGDFGYSLIDCTKVALTGCQAIALATGPTAGFYIAASSAPAGDITLTECLAQNFANVPNASGFFISPSAAPNTLANLVLKGCVANNNETGFLLKSGIAGIVIEQCVAEADGGMVGFLNNDSPVSPLNSGIVRECTANYVLGIGFQDNPQVLSLITYVSNASRANVAYNSGFASAPFYRVITPPTSPTDPWPTYWQNVGNN